MIARISGKLVFKSPSYVIIDVHGIGYQIFIPLSSYYPLCETGEYTSLFTYTHVREDALMLFGFFTEEEKRLFELLIGVSKVGSKLAINILSGISVNEFISAVAEGDVVKLNSISGVGKKTAERMLLELKDKMGRGSFYNTHGVSEKQNDETDSIFSDALSALTNLGYKKDNAERVIKKVRTGAKSEIAFEELIKNALRELSHGR